MRPRVRVPVLREKLRPLREPAFRGLGFGAVCSAVTDGMIPVAFAVYSVHAFGSAAVLTSVLLALWAGRLACTPLAGIAAARYDRFAVMIAAEAARIAAQGGLALVLLSADHDPPGALIASAALFGAATAFYGPALHTVLPRIVPTRDLRTANALLAAVADIGLLGGPALAVVLLGTVGFVWILVLDTVTFGLNLAALVYARRRAPVIAPDARREPGTTGPGEAPAALPSGVPRSTAVPGAVPAPSGNSLRATLARARWLGWSVLLWFVVSFAIGLVAVAGPVLAVERGGGGLWAVVATGMAVAGLAGSAAVVASPRRIGWRFAMVAMSVVVVVELAVLTGYAHGVVGAVPLCAGIMAAGFAIAVTGIVWQSLIQAMLPTAALGRFSSLEGFADASGVPAGMVVGGLALSTAGIEVVAGAVAVALVAATVAARSGAPATGPGDAVHGRDGWVGPATSGELGSTT
ncbi:MFS transporter [Nocardia sp. NPDC003345]